MSELGQLLPGDGPIKLKVSACHQDMGQNVLQYVFLKNQIKEIFLVKLHRYTECSPFHQTELYSGILARAWYTAVSRSST